MNGKYVNSVPLYRLEKEFGRYGLSVTRQNMASWMWVYRSGYMYPDKQIVLCEYQKHRNVSYPSNSSKIIRESV